VSILFFNYFSRGGEKIFSPMVIGGPVIGGLSARVSPVPGVPGLSAPGEPVVSAPVSG
jgi:hypothetical protein